MFELFDTVNIFLSSDDGGSFILALLAVGPTAAVIFFRRMHKKYRNFDVSHGFEKETEVFGENMQKSDKYATARNRARDKFIKGRNSHTHRVRVQEF